MAIVVMIPLHTDATRFDGEALWSDELDACVDSVANAFGGQLELVAHDEWPELQQLYSDCLLIDTQGTEERNYRFNSKSGQLVVNNAVDCRPLLAVSVEEQTIAVLDGVAAAAAKAFAKRSRPMLAEVAEGFRRQLTVDFVSQCMATDARGSAKVGSRESEPIPLDAEDRIRHVRALPDQPGELWLMATSVLGDMKFDDAISQIERHVLDSELGQPNGSAVGSDAFDLSLDVESLAGAGAELDRFLRAALPQLDYLISDDYEPMLEERDRGLC